MSEEILMPNEFAGKGVLTLKMLICLWYYRKSYQLNIDKKQKKHINLFLLAYIYTLIRVHFSYNVKHSCN